MADAKYSEYYKVAFVRNPFDRLVSWYTMITQKCIHLSEEEKSKHPNLIWRQVLLYSNSFETFIERSEDIQSRSGWKPFYNNQVDYLMDKEGSITVDYIGKFESLQKDFSTVAGKLGLHNSTLPHKNQSKHRSYRDYYNEKTIEIVMQRYRRDLEFFGYTF